MTVPGYWMHETSGVLRPAVERYLAGEPLTDPDIAAMRAYLRQWMRGDFRGEAIEELRRRVEEIYDHETLSKWLLDAIDAGIDPL